jgi:hypothetical protein
MDWTTMGASPPMVTLPTRTGMDLRRLMLLGAAAMLFRRKEAGAVTEQ